MSNGGPMMVQSPLPMPSTPSAPGAAISTNPDAIVSSTLAGASAALGDLYSTPSRTSRKRKATSEDETMTDRGNSPSPSPSRTPIITPAKRIKMALTAHLLRTGMKEQAAAALAAQNSGVALPTTSAPSSLATSAEPSDPSSQAAAQHNRKEQEVLPLKRILETLEKDDLLQIITTLVADHPGLEGPVAALLPRPTLTSASSHIQQTAKRLDASFPYSRFGQDRSDYAFNRVRPHLLELIELVSLYLTYFTEPSSYPPAEAHEYPSTAFGFLKIASKAAANLPTWQTDTHNLETKIGLYNLISQAWRVAIAEVSRRMREEGRMYGAVLVGEWYRDLLTDSNSFKEGPSPFGEALDDFQRNLGWIIGVGPTPPTPASANSTFSFFPMMSGHGGAMMSPHAMYQPRP
ncbi:Tethering factor for nuclear proteasome sts1 [Chytridiales sp. JEL 0842]|nr:Tethering factor for nuclear proteasome sts1 [Chytridiales sp. JEL 0842]